MRALLLFLLLACGLIAEESNYSRQMTALEGEPSSLIGDVVSAITGDLYMRSQDAVIIGAEPIELKRFFFTCIDQPGRKWFYFFNLSSKFFANMRYFSFQDPFSGVSLQFLAYGQPDKHDNVLYLKPLGSPLAKGYTNCARGEISGSNFLGNEYAEMTKDAKKVVVHRADGSQLIYKKTKEKKIHASVYQGYKKGKKHIDTVVFYRLIQYSLPNTHHIVFHYEKKKNKKGRNCYYLAKIETTNKERSQVYAWLRFTYDDPLKPSSCLISSSDGQRFTCLYEKRKFKDENGKSKDLYDLSQIISSNIPNENFIYDKRRCLTQRSLPNHRTVVFEYNKERLVTCIKGPIGDDNQLIPMHRIQYHQGKLGETDGYTEAFDADGNKTVYRYTDKMRLSQIESYEGGNNLRKIERFSWTEDGKILSRCLLNEQSEPLLTKSYEYDSFSNPVIEKWIGKFTGNYSFQDMRVIQRSYSQDGKNLLLKEISPNGKTTLFEYVAGTNLLSKKLTLNQQRIIRREFFYYDGDYLLTREVIDDGSSSDLNNLTDVTEQKIRVYHLRNQQPFFGLPEIIEEKYLEKGHEKLLKKRVLHYDNHGKVIKEDIYDANDVLCYSLHKNFNDYGQITKETNPLGQEAHYAYDINGNQTDARDFSGLAYHKIYDFSNRVIQQEEIGKEGIKHVSYHQYDKKHRERAFIDYLGNETQFQHDAAGNLTQTVYPQVVTDKGQTERPITSAVYDAAGMPICKTDPNGNITYLQYNSLGQPLDIRYPNGGTESFTYDVEGRLVTYRDREDTFTSYTYDILGRVVSKKVVDRQKTALSKEVYVYSTFHLLKQINAEEYQTHYTYDGAGRKIQENYEGKLTEWVYDPLGRIEKEVHNNELVIAYERDLLDRILGETQQDIKENIFTKKTHGYDSQGNLVETTEFHHNQPCVQYFRYDSFHRLKEQVDALGNTTQLFYDEGHTNTLGQRVLQKTTVDPLGLQQIETYDALNRLIVKEMRNPSKQTIAKEELIYDLKGNQTAQSSHIFIGTSFSHTIHSQWEYNSEDAVIKQIEALGTNKQKITSYNYTLSGLLSHTYKPDGVVLEYRYDGRGLLHRLSSSDRSIDYSYSYNRLGQMLGSTDLTKLVSTDRTFNAHGQILIEKLDNGLTLKSQYDLSGRKIALLLPDGASIDYAYDPLYLREVSKIGPQGNVQYAHQYLSYDLAGNLTEQSLPGDLGTIYFTHDALGRKISITSQLINQTLSQFDARGNLIEMVLDGKTCRFAYDDLSQLLSEEGVFNSSYSYDSHYNRRVKNQDVYSLNELNELMRTKDAEYVYDLNGNPITKKTSKGTINFVYDALDRLIEVNQDNQKVTFTYDGMHRRTSKFVYNLSSGKWSKSSQQFFLYDDQNEIGSTDGSKILKELRILGLTSHAEIGAGVAFEIQGNVYFPAYDLQGNVSKLVALSRKGESLIYHYNSFGESTYESPKGSALAQCNPWQFSSKRQDPETGLIFFGRRYYDPQTGRWLTPDPEGYTDSMNLYAYVLNNPLTHLDLYGLIGTYGMNSRIYQLSKEQGFALNDYKQMGIGIAHGFGGFALNSSLAVANIGYGLSLPFRAAGWAFGKGSFSEDWASFKRSNEAFYSAGDRLMHSAIKGDTNHRMYQNFRYGVEDGLALGSVAVGGFGALNKIKHYDNLSIITRQFFKKFENQSIAQPKIHTVSRTWNNSINPFRGKTFQQIDRMFHSKGFILKGPDPLNGKGAYFHPITNRKYYLDHAGKTYRDGIMELPHVDVHYNIPVNGVEKQRFPLGEYLYESK